MPEELEVPDEFSLPPFDIQVTDDRLRVLFSGEWPAGHEPAMQRAVESHLAELGILARPADAVFEELGVVGARSGERVTDFCLLAGERPVPPIDGHIDWARDFFNTAFMVDETTGQIDYRKRQSQLSLQEQELIARVVKGREGVDGTDVFGKRIRAATPYTPVIKVGEGVREEVEKRRYYAARDGRFRWDGTTLSVDDVYTIEGNVSLESGDVDHRGAVVITGDVEAGAAITATGDIEVMGVLEAAAIQTGGSLMVRCGIFGRPGLTIEVGGDVFARFVIEGHIRARGSITVEREIVNSTVTARGALQVTAGRAFGGQMLAHGGVSVRQLGSDGFVPTTVTVGEDPFLHDLVAPLEKESAEIQERIEHLASRLRPLMAHRERLPEDKKRAIAELLKTSSALSAELDRLKAEIRHLREASETAARYRVSVQDALHSEVMVHMRGETYRTTDDLLGPLVLGWHHGAIEMTAQ